MLADAALGAVFAAAGDVDGDGASDLIVATRATTPIASVNFRLILGRTMGALSLGPIVNRAGAFAVASLAGVAVGGTGDVNADQRHDIAFGLADSRLTGRLVVGRDFNGTAFTEGTFSLVDPGGLRSIAMGGDGNGDGYGDTVICTANIDMGTAGQGELSLLRGGPTGPGSSVLLGNGMSPTSNFGARVHWMADTTGDGLSDVALLEPNWVTGGAAVGRGLLFLGQTTGIPWMVRTVPGAAGQEVISVAPVGDFDGDGTDELAILRRVGAATAFSVRYTDGTLSMPTPLGSVTSPIGPAAAR